MKRGNGGRESMEEGEGMEEGKGMEGWGWRKGRLGGRVEDGGRLGMDERWI